MEYIDPISTETEVLEQLENIFDMTPTEIESFPDDIVNYQLLAPTAILVNWRGDDVSDSITKLGDTLQTITDNLDISVIGKKLHPTASERGEAVLCVIRDIINGHRDLNDTSKVIVEGLRGFKISDGRYLVYKGTKFVDRSEEEWWYQTSFTIKTGLE